MMQISTTTSIKIDKENCDSPSITRKIETICHKQTLEQRRLALVGNT